MLIKNYTIQKKICETRGSIVYKTTNDLTIKIEKTGFDYLKNEIKMRKFLEKIDGVLKIKDFGVHQNERFLVYPFIEETLYKKVLSESLIYTLAQQLITTVSLIHSKGVIHCDISVCNILYDNIHHCFYLNDFGQAKQFSFAMNEKNNEPLVGCPLFCSENVHKGYDYSPRDDLISLGYVFFYLFLRKLPWGGIKNIQYIHEEKRKFREKFWNLPIPEEFKIYMNYCFHLNINERPKYTMLKQLFTNKTTTTTNLLEVST